MRNRSPGFTWSRFCASSGTARTCRFPAGPRMVTVRALASTLVTVTTASTGSVTTATLGWASAPSGNRKANTGQAVFMGGSFDDSLVGHPVAPARRVGAHLLAEVGEVIHHVL